MTLYNQAKDSIEDLKESMEKYLRLSPLTQEGPDAELDKLIVDNQAAIEVYSLTFENIKGQNIPSRQKEQLPGQPKQPLRLPSQSDSNSTPVLDQRS